LKHQVRLTANAERDVESVLRWFNEQSAAAAGARWFAQLMSRIARLESHPTRCALAAEAEELGLEIRDLHFGKRRGTYRILFQIRDRTVQILRICHSARDALTGDDL